MTRERGEVRLIDGALVRALPQHNIVIRDTALRGFQVRVRCSGRRGITATYRVQLGRGRIESLGRVGVVDLTEARKAARNRLATIALNLEPVAADVPEPLTLRQFLESHYAAWVTEARKSGDETLALLRSCFADLLDVPLAELSVFRLEQWRLRRLKARRTPATINRNLTALKSALQTAVEWRLIATHPLRGLKPSRTDRRGVVRYLSPDEEQRLRDALTAREDRRRAARAQHNAWRGERQYPLVPDFGAYTDHIVPLVLLALNTGCRRGELFQLTWRDVDLARALLTVRGTATKNAQTRHLPLNQEALTVLRDWRPATAAAAALVFPGATADTPLADIKSAWRALVKQARLRDFRFHDCRHTFASKLVMRGVDLSTVRELLGHATFEMTTKYAHLAPEHKAAAVAKLISA